MIGLQLRASFSPHTNEGWWGCLRLAKGCMAVSMRSLKTMASIVWSSVRMKSRTEQVAEPSSDRAMRLHPSPEQAGPPSLYPFQACSLHSSKYGLDQSQRARLDEHRPSDSPSSLACWPAQEWHPCRSYCARGGSAALDFTIWL